MATNGINNHMWIWTYIQERTPFKKFTDLLLVATVGAWIGATYMIATNYSSIHAMVFPKHELSLKSLVALDKHINKELDSLLTLATADRIGVYRYHTDANSPQSTTAYLYATETNEVARPGISLESTKRQVLLLS